MEEEPKGRKKKKKKKKKNIDIDEDLYTSKINHKGKGRVGKEDESSIPCH